MDLTIEVMLPPRGAADFTTAANPKYRLLAPIAVYPLLTVAVVKLQCTGYVHVTGVPDRPLTEQFLQRVNSRLCNVWEEEVLGGQERIVNRIERRIWRSMVEIIPAARLATLLTERQITVTWTQFKNFMQHMVELRNLDDTDLD